MEELTLHDKLMCSRHQGEAIVVIEGFRYILPECVACSTRRYAPATAIIGIGPEKITHGTFMWNLLYTVNASNMV